MIDLEDQLRDDFATLASTPLDLGVEAGNVIDAGRRRHRSRTVRSAIGGAAVVVLALAVGWGWLSASVPSRSSVVPAAPAPSTLWLANPAYFDLDGWDLGTTTSFRRVTLDVTPNADGWEVRVDLEKADGVLLATSTFQAAAGVSVTKLSPQVSLVLLPTRTNWLDVAMKTPDTAPAHIDSTYPGTLDVTAVLLGFDSARQADDLAGLIWVAADGTMVDTLGNAVATSTVVVRGQTVTLYDDGQLERQGLRLDRRAIGLHTRARPGWAAYPRLQSYETAPTGDTSTWVLADVLPKGAHDVSVRLTTTQGDWTSFDLGGRTAYVIVATSKGSTQPVRSLSYLDAGGRTVSFRT